jgi:hypothetical protein
MNMPGFTAEASIYNSEEFRGYVANSARDSNGKVVVPQQFDFSSSSLLG